MSDSIQLENAYHRGAITTTLEAIRADITAAGRSCGALLDSLPTARPEDVKNGLVTLESFRLALMEDLRRAFGHANLLKPTHAGDKPPAEAPTALPTTVHPPTSRENKPPEGGAHS